MKKCSRWFGVTLGFAVSGTLLGGCAVAAEHEMEGNPGAAGQGADETADAIATSTSQRVIMQTPTGPREVPYVDIDGIAYVEGDIELGPVEELEALTTEKGIGVNDRNLLWPRRTMPFVFDSTLSGTMQARTLQAMAEWNRDTGFTFVPRTNETEYVRFTNSNGVCSSSPVGRVPGGQTTIRLNHGRAASQIVGLGIDPKFQVVAAWYSDSTMSVGSATRLDQGAATTPFTLPPNRTTAQIVSMDIAADNRVFTWFSDGMFTIGSTVDLGKFAGPASFKMPAPYKPSNIVGMAFALDGRVVTYLSDGKALVGTALDLGKNGGPVAYGMPAGLVPADIVDVLIRNDSNTSAYYTNNSFSVGVVNSIGSVTGPKPFVTTLDCPIPTVIHEIGHAVGLWHEHSRCDREAYVNVLIDNVQDPYKGNFAQICSPSARDLAFYDFDSIMHYGSFNSFSKVSATGDLLPTITRKYGEFIYPNRTSLSPGDIRSVDEMYGYSPAKGHSSANFVGALATTNTGYYYYDDGTFYTSTNANDHDATGGPSAYLPAQGKTYAQIVAMDFDQASGLTYTWYSDGTVSKGLADDLDAWGGTQSFRLPAGYTVSQIVGIAIYAGRVYYFYSDGKRSIGSSAIADKFQAPTTYTTATGRTAAQIKEVAISQSNGTVFAWYDDYGLSAGSDVDLDVNMEAW